MFTNWLAERRKRRAAATLADKIPVAIERFAALIVKHPAAYIDESWLPLPKAEMKSVLKVAIAAERDPKRLEWLKVGWVFLSQFQPNVGDVPVTANVPGTPTPAALASLDRFVQIGVVAQAESERNHEELQAFLATAPRAR